MVNIILQVLHALFLLTAVMLPVFVLTRPQPKARFIAIWRVLTGYSFHVYTRDANSDSLRQVRWGSQSEIETIYIELDKEIEVDYHVEVAKNIINNTL